MSGVSVHTSASHGGRHAACGAGWKRNLWLAAAVPIGIAIGLAAVLTILAANLALAIRKAAVTAWAHTGPVGQLATEAAGCMVAGRLMGDLGFIPDGTLAPTALGTGGVIGLVVMHRRRARLQEDRGQREWRQRGKANEVIQGGWQEYAASHEAVSEAALVRIGECESRLAAHDARFEAVFDIMREAAEAAGLACGPAENPRPKLTVITNHHYRHGA